MASENPARNACDFCCVAFKRSGTAQVSAVKEEDETFGFDVKGAIELDHKALAAMAIVAKTGGPMTIEIDAKGKACVFFEE